MGQLVKERSCFYCAGSLGHCHGDILFVCVLPSLVRSEVQYAALDAHQLPLGAGRLGIVELSLSDGVEGDSVKDLEQAMLPGVIPSETDRRGRVPDGVDGPSYELIPTGRLCRVNLDT